MTRRATHSPTDLELPPAQQVVEDALSQAGGDAVVIVEDSSQAEVRFANNTTTTNGVRRDRRVTVIRFLSLEEGITAGVARRSGIVDIEELLGTAQRDAEQSEPSEDAAPLVDGGIDEDFGAGPGTTDLSTLRRVVSDLSHAFSAARSDNRVLAGFAEHGVSTVYLGSTAGTRRRYEQPAGSLQLVGRSLDGSRSAWAGRATADFTDISVDELDTSLRERLAWATRTVSLPAGRYEVILPPEATADLMVDLAEAASGRDAEDGRSVFSRPGGGTRLGEPISSLPFDLRSDPAEPGLACSPFLVAEVSSSDVSVFDNGLPLRRTPWLDAGRLAHLRYHRAGAARSNVEPTPPIDNLVLELPGSSGTTADLVARTERGLLLTCLWYIREVDPATLLLTGLTRDGVYLIENGEITGATNNFRFNESPVDLLARTTDVGASVRALGREFGEWMNLTRMPPLRIPDFNMSSVSQAS